MCSIWLVCSCLIGVSEGFLRVEQGCWPNGIVPYKIKDGFTEEELSTIRQQMAVFHETTCIRWMNLDEVSLAVNYSVEFSKGSKAVDCVSLAHYADDGRFVHAIAMNSWCIKKHMLLHEMMHALGFKHEHQRTDRDCYVLVEDPVFDRVRDPNYRIIWDESDWMERFPYDKYSIMHYPRTIEMKARTERWYQFYEPLGNVDFKLTQLDVWKLLYRFCNYPHFCEQNPDDCRKMYEGEKNCRK